MTVWILSLAIAAIAALFIASALWRSRGSADPARFDVQVYRDQLREVERDLARGVLTDSEAEAVRTEVSRRLLEADRAAQEATPGTRAPKGLTWAATALVALVLVGGAGAIYWRVGQPGYPDLPLEKRLALADEALHNRIGQDEAEAQIGHPTAPPEGIDPKYLELVQKLRDTVAERPDDLQGQVLLARSETQLGNFAAAHRAKAQVIALKGDQATADDYAELADLLVLATNGYVSPEAELALRHALALDPENKIARFYSGLLAIQTGRQDIGFNLWRRLLEEGPEDAPWIPMIRDRIGELARVAGVDYTPPGAAPARGPSAADVAAAGEMTPEERQGMIRTMVAGLADRLANEGGPPEDWARLIRAYGVLGETDQAKAIWAEAQQKFPDEATQAVILQAARDAGVAE